MHGQRYLEVANSSFFKCYNPYLYAYAYAISVHSSNVNSNAISVLWIMEQRTCIRIRSCFYAHIVLGIFNCLQSSVFRARSFAPPLFFPSRYLIAFSALCELLSSLGLMCESYIWG